MEAAPLLKHQADEAAASLPALLVAAERVAATVAQGVHGRRRVGQGDSFWQFRHYTQGDARARIDWRESAKSEHLYVRESEWEAAQSVWIWRDSSPSMDYASSAHATKRQRADLLALALAALLIRGGERVGLLGSGSAPASGRAVLDRLALLLTRPGTSEGHPPFEPLPRYGQLVLIGDWLTPLEEVHRDVNRFAGRGMRGHLLQILDPAEETLPFEGRVRFVGLEEETPILLSRVETVRDDYAARLHAHREGLAAIARGSGWSFALHHTDKPPHLALLALYGVLAASARRGWER
ncbi:MAG TPA: DUF58 domain-containing protein [Stellaceae bacterium]|nr:DUF58 domain-containing protein [Stellaceae bacterium]